MGCTISRSESRSSSKADHEITRLPFLSRSNADKSRRCSLLKNLETSGGRKVPLYALCQVDCETCGLVFQAGEKWGLPKPVGPNTYHHPQTRPFLVSLTSSTEAGISFLSIGSAESSIRVQFYAIEGRSHNTSLPTLSLECLLTSEDRNSEPMEPYRQSSFYRINQFSLVPCSCSYLVEQMR